MKLVIEIDEDKYEWIKNHTGVTDYHTTEMLYEGVQNGTPLPKGHGRLIDGDKLLDDLRGEYCYLLVPDDCLDEVKVAIAEGTIILADKEESE